VNDIKVEIMLDFEASEKCSAGFGICVLISKLLISSISRMRENLPANY
jgi:hypothetical protein